MSINVPRQSWRVRGEKREMEAAPKWAVIMPQAASAAATSICTTSRRPYPNEPANPVDATAKRLVPCAICCDSPMPPPNHRALAVLAATVGLQQQHPKPDVLAILLQKMISAI
eukprot:scaffold2422_cov56-Attheya_sp.AAC.8